RAYHLARLLSTRFDLAIACCSDTPVPDADRRVLESLATDVAIQRISGLGGRVRGGLALGVGRAITPAIFYRRALARTIAQWHRSRPFDAVLTYCTGMTLYARAITQDEHFRTRGRHVLDLVDVDSVKWQNYASMTNPPMKFAYAAEANLLR